LLKVCKHFRLLLEEVDSCVPAKIINKHYKVWEPVSELVSMGPQRSLCTNWFS
jgi:hypothetical protein